MPIIGNLSLFKLWIYLLGKTEPQLVDKLEVWTEIMTRIRMKLVSDKFVGYGILVHLIAIFFCGFTLIYQQTLKKESGSNQSFHPGFFCDDPKIKLPYVEEQVSTLACAVIWIVAAVVVVLVRTKSFKILKQKAIQF